MSEEWRPIAGYEGFYEVSSLGRVRSLDREFIRSDGQRQGRRGRVLVATLAGKGYPSVTLRFGLRRNVHVLVCTAFHGQRPTDVHEVAHGNGDPSDNRASNLRWATPSENQMDSIRHGTKFRLPVIGEDNGNAKLTADAVASIRSRSLAGESERKLAVAFGMGKSQIHNIVSGKQWQKPRQEWAV